jgi:hypothetical protein
LLTGSRDQQVRVVFVAHVEDDAGRRAWLIVSGERPEKGVLRQGPAAADVEMQALAAAEERGRE